MIPPFKALYSGLTSVLSVSWSLYLEFNPLLRRRISNHFLLGIKIENVLSGKQATVYWYEDLQRKQNMIPHLLLFYYIVMIGILLLTDKNFNIDITMYTNCRNDDYRVV